MGQPDDRERHGEAAGEAPGRGRRTATAALVVVLVAPAALLWSWSRPRPAAPREMPALALPPAEVRAQIDADRAAAARAPDDAVERERREVYAEANEAELDAQDPPGRALRRQRRLAEALEALARAHGDEGVGAARAADLDRAERAMRGELPEVRRAGELGGFVDMMRRWGMVDGEAQVAPRFVVRTAFKARWNAMFGREPTDGMSEIERRAHWGWLGLRAETAPVAARLEGLDRYAEAGGERAAEARGVLLYEEGLGDEARRAFEAAHAERPTFRLRNHALAASLR